MRIKSGMKMPDFKMTTSLGDEVDFYEIIGKNDKTVLMFLRYAGCTVCQLDLMEYKDLYSTFREKDTEVIIVLQSSLEILKDMTMPYIIASDPDFKLYRMFDVVPAKSMLGLLSFKTVKRVLKSKKEGLVHGKYEGEELQLPAVFIVGQDGYVTYGHYAKNLGDMPSGEEVLSKINH